MTIEHYQQTLLAWLSTFCKVYRGAVPDTEKKPLPSPHIVYSPVSTTFSTSFSQPLYLYAPGATDFTALTALADRIIAAVGVGGLHIRNGDGCIRIEHGNPLYQDRPDYPDKNCKAGYLLLNITIY